MHSALPPPPPGIRAARGDTRPSGEHGDDGAGDMYRTRRDDFATSAPFTTPTASLPRAPSPAALRPLATVMLELDGLASRLRRMSSVGSMRDEAWGGDRAAAAATAATASRSPLGHAGGDTLERAPLHAPRGSSLASILAPLTTAARLAEPPAPATADDGVGCGAPSAAAEASPAGALSEPAPASPPPASSSPASSAPDGGPLGGGNSDSPPPPGPPCFAFPVPLAVAGGGAAAAAANELLDGVQPELRRLQALLLRGAIFVASGDGAGGAAPRGHATRVRLLPDLRTLTWEGTDGGGGVVELADVGDVRATDGGRGVALLPAGGGPDAPPLLRVVAADRLLGADWRAALAVFVSVARVTA